MTIVGQRVKSNFLTYYQCFLAVTSVLVFFTEADNYFFDIGITPAPKNVVLLFCLASTPLLISLRSRNFQYIPMSVIIWCSLYLGISAASFLHSVPTGGVIQEFETRVLTVIFLLLMTLIFSGEPIVRKYARWTLFIAIFITIFNNFSELLDPLAFNGLNQTGRPAGFYKDPNKSAAALIMGLIFTIGLVPKRIRFPYFLLIFVGSFITFSRGAFLCLLMLLVYLVLKRSISVSQFFPIISLLIIFFAVGDIGNYLIYQAQDSGIVSSSIARRIEAITNITDPDARETDGGSRTNIATIAWRTFLKKPFIGYGIGYIKEWNEILPHNMYLTFMIEHGFIGVLIVPSLVFAANRNAYREARRLGFLFGCFILIWSIFSNTVLKDREILMMFALLAVTSKYSRLKQSNMRRL
ncbi:MAG: O-antigen ligase family protein [Rivularia sp. (in: cyanobacteria)]